MKYCLIQMYGTKAMNDMIQMYVTEILNEWLIQIYGTEIMNERLVDPKVWHKCMK